MFRQKFRTSWENPVNIIMDEITRVILTISIVILVFLFGGDICHFVSHTFIPRITSNLTTAFTPVEVDLKSVRRSSILSDEDLKNLNELKSYMADDTKLIAEATGRKIEKPVKSSSTTKKSVKKKNKKWTDKVMDSVENFLEKVDGDGSLPELVGFLK